MKKVDMVVDLQYGSTGKGLFAGWLSVNDDYDTVINANMPNAGHTYIDQFGNKMMHKVLPSGVCGKYLQRVMIGPGAIFSIGRLVEEIEHLRELGYMRNTPIFIHPNAVVLQDYHRRAEQGMDNIGSTKQGAGAALIEKLRRNPSTSSMLLASSSETRIKNKTGDQVLVVTHREWQNLLLVSRNILAEGAQGYSLGLNGRFWPYCTSRDCTPTRFLSEMGIPLGMHRATYGTCRVHPIRVGGNSGSCYEDQRELTWAELGQPEELTTVTKKVRRVFTWSDEQMRDAMFECGPDRIFLNFANYDVEQAYELAAAWGVDWLGFGPTHNDIMRYDSNG